MVHGDYGEWVAPIEYRVSDQLVRDGITWEWFPENWSFGSGVSIHKTTAYWPTKVIDWGTQKSLSQLLDAGGIVDLSRVQLLKIHNRTEGWAKYEERWRPGTCPQESHQVYVTWVITVDKLPEFAYQRLTDLIERKAEPKDLWRYSASHFSQIYKWQGKPDGALDNAKSILGV